MDVLINGFLGINGFGLTKACLLSDGIAAVGGADIALKKSDLKKEYVRNTSEAVTGLNFIDGRYDVLIDFSSPKATPYISEYVSKTCTPALILTTGQSEKDIKLLKRAAKIAPVAVIKNASAGINAVAKILRPLSSYLDGYSVGITETHRRGKKDCPSGTALFLKDCIAESVPNSSVEMNSVRLFNEFGKHEIIFRNGEEQVTVTHEVLSRSCFYSGAINIAKKLITMPAGFYTDTDF
ncbi:MAG: hypothetical protein HP008_05885 [Clostridia bacterium]|nr:hypothetical protein [Clostridia bacterium]